MAKLRSISKQIPWFLAAKAAVFGALWFFVPWWVFFIAASYLYFVPVFQSKELLLPFVIIMGLSILMPNTGFVALLLSAAFFLVAGIKDLVFIDRAIMYEILVFFILITAFGGYFMAVAKGSVSFSLISALGMAGLFFYLLRGFLNYAGTAKGARAQFLALSIASFLVWEVTFAVLFLPLNALSQTAVLFAVAAILTEFVFDHLRGRLSKQALLMKGSAFAVIMVAIGSVTHWTL